VGAGVNVPANFQFREFRLHILSGGRGWQRVDGDQGKKRTRHEEGRAPKKRGACIFFAPRTTFQHHKSRPIYAALSRCRPRSLPIHTIALTVGVQRTPRFRSPNTRSRLLEPSRKDTPWGEVGERQMVATCLPPACTAAAAFVQRGFANSKTLMRRREIFDAVSHYTSYRCTIYDSKTRQNSNGAQS